MPTHQDFPWERDERAARDRVARAAAPSFAAPTRQRPAAGPWVCAAALALAGLGLGLAGVPWRGARGTVGAQAAPPVAAAAARVWDSTRSGAVVRRST